MVRKLVITILFKDVENAYITVEIEEASKKLEVI